MVPSVRPSATGLLVSAPAPGPATYQKRLKGSTSPLPPALHTHGQAPDQQPQVERDPVIE